MTTKAQALARLTVQGEQLGELQEAIAATVSQAREVNATWREIATALGTTPSNVHRKYADRRD